jgi:hypothetical protein
MAGSQYLEDDAIGGVKDELIASVEGGRVRSEIAVAPLAA